MAQRVVLARCSVLRSRARSAGMARSKARASVVQSPSGTAADDYASESSSGCPSPATWRDRHLLGPGLHVNRRRRIAAGEARKAEVAVGDEGGLAVGVNAIWTGREPTTATRSRCRPVLPVRAILVADPP